MDLQSESSNHYDPVSWTSADIDACGSGGFNPDESVRVTQQNSIAFVTRVADRATFEVALWLPTFTLGELHKLRPEIRSAGVRQEYPFVCGACGEPVVLKAYMDHGHFFLILRSSVPKQPVAHSEKIVNCPKMIWIGCAITASVRAHDIFGSRN